MGERPSAQAPRVEGETSQTEVRPKQVQIVEVEHTPANPPTPPARRAIPMISQDDPEEPKQARQQQRAPVPEGPAYNTRQQTLTQEVALACMDIGGHSLRPVNAASRKFPLQMLCDWAGVVLDGETGELLEYRHLMARPKYKEVWGISFGNEIGRLVQGMKGRVEGTNTMSFIHKREVPKNRYKDVTYGRIVCGVRPGKAEPNRTRLTVGGDKINYPKDCGTPMADLLTVKLLLNSVVSTPGAKFMTLDIKNFYLNAPLKRPKYLRLRIKDFPEDVINEYQLRDKVTTEGHLFVFVNEGM